MLSQYVMRRSINSCTNEYFLCIFLFIITVLYVALYMITNVIIYVVIQIQTKDRVGLSAIVVVVVSCDYIVSNMGKIGNSFVRT